MKKQKLLIENYGDQCVENFDETIHLQPERRDEWIRRVRERLHGTADCRRVKNEERKDSSYQICQRKRAGRLVDAAETSEELLE